MTQRAVRDRRAVSTREKALERGALKRDERGDEQIWKSEGDVEILTQFRRAPLRLWIADVVAVDRFVFVSHSEGRASRNEDVGHRF